MTSATRFSPPRAGVAAQMESKDAVPRGFAESCESSLTENRNPCTSPSDGRAVDGPCEAYTHAEPSRSQNDQ